MLYYTNLSNLNKHVMLMMGYFFCVVNGLTDLASLGNEAGIPPWEAPLTPEDINLLHRKYFAYFINKDYCF